jgi:hypothetical protein
VIFERLGELVRSTSVKINSKIIRSGGCSERSARPNSNRIDGLGVAYNLPET